MIKHFNYFKVIIMLLLGLQITDINAQVIFKQDFENSRDISIYQSLINPANNQFTRINNLLPDTVKSSIESGGLIIFRTNAVTVGNPNPNAQQEPSLLWNAIKARYNAGARVINVKPGIYKFTNPTQGSAKDLRSTLIFNNMNDVTINFYGCTFENEGGFSNNRLIYIENCTNLTIAGGTLISTKPCAIQGKIISLTKSGQVITNIEFKSDLGYDMPDKGSNVIFPNNDTEISGINFIDPVTKKLKWNLATYYQKTSTFNTTTSNYNIAFNTTGSEIKVGDYLVARNGKMEKKVWLQNAQYCVVKDMELRNNGFAAIREIEGGHNKFINVKWSIGEKPAGATIDPLISSSADGFHSTNTYYGPLIDGCIFSGVLLDDPIAVRGSFAPAHTGTTGKNLKIATPDFVFKIIVNDTLRFGTKGEAKVLSVSLDAGGASSTIVLDTDLGIQVGDTFSNPATCGPFTVVRNCIIGGTRSRGIIIKADDVLIENNVIEDCGASAISLGPEIGVYVDEAGYFYRNTIRKNTITSCGFTGAGFGTIWTHGQPIVNNLQVIGNKNLIITNNKFSNNFIRDIYIDAVDGVSITNNTICVPAFRDANSNALLISILNRKATFSNNKVYTPIQNFVAASVNAIAVASGMPSGNVGAVMSGNSCPPTN
jgi:hypothetical protein